MKNLISLLLIGSALLMMGATQNLSDVVPQLVPSGSIVVSATPNFTWTASGPIDCRTRTKLIDNVTDNLVLSIRGTKEYAGDVLTTGLLQITDSSSNTLTVTASGASKITSEKDLNETVHGSIRIPNGNNDAIGVSSNSAFALGTSNFTLQMNVMFNTDYNNVNACLACIANYDNGLDIRTNESGSNKLDIYVASGTAISWDWTRSALVKYAVKITRTGNTFELFVDGTSLGTKTATGSITQGAFTIGKPNSGATGSYFNGWVSDIQLYNVAQ